jgi:predicted nucleic acid-binding protein
MPPKYDRRRATVVAFDTPAWEPPDVVVVVDTNVVAEALLQREPEHDVCDGLLQRLVQARTLVVFSRLLEVELWEVVFNHALRTHTDRRDTRHSRYRRDARHAASVTLDRAVHDWNELLDRLAWDCVEGTEHHRQPDRSRALGRRRRLPRLRRAQHQQAEEAIELGGGDGGQRQVAVDPHLALARVREAHERHLAVPAQQVVRLDPIRFDHLRLRAQHAVADRHADVQRPARRVDGDAPLGERDLTRLALQGGDVGVDDAARIS